MSFKHEIGDRFLDPSDGEKVTILCRTMTDDVEWYWVAPDSRLAPWTISGDSLKHWKKIEPFFEVGDWWVDGKGNRYDVTHVDTDLEEPAAWVRGTYKYGRPSRGTFTSSIWRVRKDEIIRNRNKV